MRSVRILAALAALILAGCVETKSPPFLPDDLVFDPGLLGDWAHVPALPLPADDPAPTTLNRVEAVKGTSYRVSVNTDPKDWMSFSLFKLGDRYFIATHEKEGGYGVCRVVASGDTLRFWSLDVSAVLADDPGRVAHETSITLLSAPVLTLTGPTSEVRAFLARHSDDPAVWVSTPTVYRRKDGLKLTTAGLTGRKQRTLDYWAELRSTLQGGRFSVGDAGAGTGAEWKRVAAALGALCAEGVDPEAAACGLLGAEFCEAAAAYARSRRRPADPLAAFVRHATGVAIDTATLPPGREALQARTHDTVAKLEAARAKLAARHGGEFLPIR